MVSNASQRFGENREPLSAVHPTLVDLFSWNPPKLRLDMDPLPGEKMSTKTVTRPSSFFDKHFSDELKLLRVERLPSLVHDISTLVDKTIIGCINDNVQFSPDYLYAAKDIRRSLSNLDTTMADERDVASFYERTTAMFCSPVASILALRNPRLVVGTLRSRIAHGFLQFASPTDLARKDVLLEEAMDKETLKLFRRLSERRLPLVTHKFKNMAAVRQEVLLAIPNLSNLPIFSETSCATPECAAMTKHEQERRRKVRTVIVGHDATNTPWNFDSHSDNSMFHSDSEDREEAVPQPHQIPLASALTQLPDAVPPPTLLSRESPDVQGSSEDVGRSKAVKRKLSDGSSNQSGASSSVSTLGMLHMARHTDIPLQGTKKRKQGDLLEVTQPTRLMSSPPLPVEDVQVEPVPKQTGKRKGKKVLKGKVQAGGGDQGSDDRRNNQAVDDPFYRDDHDLSAHYIVQQAWAQATREDGSIIVLHSGNHEFIGIRHRRTQTLYISDLIVPYACEGPSYGKLHTGIYIAAIKDAINRESQVRDAGLQGGGNGQPDSGGDIGDGPNDGDDRMVGRKGGHKDEGEGSEKPEEGGDQSRENIAETTAITHETATKETTLELANSRNVILMYLQYGLYDSSAPSTFVRSRPTGQAISLPSQETVRNYQLNECLTIVLKSEIGFGATGQVLRGTLEVEASACVSLDVAVKLALTGEQRDALRNEYEIYHRLRSSGVTAGILTPLGLFDDVEGGACALVMPYIGVALADVPEVVFPISYQEAVLATLAEIHLADVLHGDLRLDNILVTDSAFTIIDFGESQVCNDQNAKNTEYSELRSLLDLNRRAKKKRHGGKWRVL